MQPLSTEDLTNQGCHRIFFLSQVFERTFLSKASELSRTRRCTGGRLCCTCWDCTARNDLCTNPIEMFTEGREQMVISALIVSIASDC